MSVSPQPPPLRSAAVRQLTRSMTLVIGPTPPIRGESQPATSAPSSATSDTNFLPANDTPAATRTPAERHSSTIRSRGTPVCMLERAADTE